MKKAKVGDWVRFYKDGRLVIGEVKYIETSGGVVFLTDQGGVDIESVLEVRSAAKPTE